MVKIKDFTPVFDTVLKRTGTSTALVYGKVWRYCQMEDGLCRASQDRLAKELGLARSTVNEALKKLVEGGYLNSSYSGYNSPNKYTITGKVDMELQAVEVVNDEMVSEIRTAWEPEVSEIPTGYVGKTDKGMSEKPTLRKDTKKQKKKEEAPLSGLVEIIDPYKRYPNPLKDVVIKFCDIWHMEAPQPVDGKRTGEFAFWLMGTREFMDACGDVSYDAVLKGLHDDWEAMRDDRKYIVNSPKSLVRMARAKAGEIRQGKVRSPILGRIYDCESEGK